MENKLETIEITNDEYIISKFIISESGNMIIDYDLPYQKQKEMERNEKNVNVR